MKGKVVVVTGATSGIGAVTAEALAQQGARVLLVGRDPKRASATIEDIRSRTAGAELESLVGDLSSWAEVRRLADEIKARTDRIDVLVNNAGAVFDRRQLSADGIEMTFALNHFAYYLLTNLVLDVLKRSAPARVVSVASDAHRFARGIDEKNLKGPNGFAGWRSYGESKLANIRFSHELARRLAGTGVTSNALHPGFVRTRFFSDKGIGGKVAAMMASVVAISPEQGAQTSIYLASAPEVEGVSGKYFVKCREAIPTLAASDATAARHLWDLSAEWTSVG